MVKVKSLSRAQLCDPVDGNLLGFSIHGIFQARILEWGAIAFSVKVPYSKPIKIETDNINYTVHKSEVAQLCPTS